MSDSRESNGTESALGPGPRLPGHDWVRPLGRGGFADVHLYRQQLPVREVAVKVLRYGGDDGGRAALAREATAMSAAQGHRGILALLGVGETDDFRPYLVSEYCPIQGLAGLVRSEPMAVRQVLSVMVALCGAVETLHRSGWVHRDIKPGNIMLTRYDRAVLGDFGVAAQIGTPPSLGADGFSALWAAPEQQRGDAPALPGQDIWALAATGWTLLQGHSPFEDPVGDNSPAAVMERVQSGRIRGFQRADLPPGLESVLRSGLQLDPQHRPASAAGLGQALQQVQRDLQLPVTDLELPRDLTPAGPGPELDPERTRTRGLTRPAAVSGAGSEETRPPPTWPVTRPAPQTQSPQTHAPQTQSPQTQSPQAPSARDRARPGWVPILAGALGLVVLVAWLTSWLTGEQRVVLAPTSTPAPLDPVGGAPDPITELSAEVVDSRVYWTWRHDGENARFIYTITRTGLDDITRDTTQPGVDTAAVPGEMCLEVTAVDAAGRGSEPVTDCVEVK